MALEITPGYGDLDSVRTLFVEYTEALGIDLSFQNYGEEVSGLPGKYAPPLGRLFLALLNGRAAGCVALRPLDNDRCEMKRFFVRPYYRKQGIGGALLEHLLREARAMPFRQVVLDTFERLDSSIRLYRSLGFVDIAPYCYNPYPNVVYLGLDLKASGQSRLCL